jgi:periplasmic divalent cation tolerance protein
VTGAVVALSTVATREDAERIARALVERRLCACVNIVPGVTSLYSWKGAVQADEELLLVIKTTREAVDSLKSTLVEMHPYEVPELVAVDIAEGHAAYLDWLRESVG